MEQILERPKFYLSKILLDINKGVRLVDKTTIVRLVLDNSIVFYERE